MEAVDERAGLGVGVGVNGLVRLAVAPEETLQAKDICVVRSANDDRSHAGSRDQADAAQDQSAHDPLADLGLGD